MTQGRLGDMPTRRRAGQGQEEIKRWNEYRKQERVGGKEGSKPSKRRRAHGNGRTGERGKAKSRNENRWKAERETGNGGKEATEKISEA